MSFCLDLNSNRTVQYRGEFRAPLGVRKSPRNEPAGQMLWLWGFEVFGKHGGAGLAPDGGSWAWILPEYFSFLAESLAQCRPIYGAMSEAAVTDKVDGRMSARNGVVRGRATRTLGGCRPCRVTIPISRLIPELVAALWVECCAPGFR